MAANVSVRSIFGANPVPSTRSMMDTLRELFQKDYIEEHALPAAVAGACAYFLADSFLGKKTLDEVGDMVEGLVGGTGVSILKSVMGESFFGEMTSIGLPALSGIGRQFSGKLAASTTDPTMPSEESLNYAKWVIAITVAAAVYVTAANDN